MKRTMMALTLLCATCFALFAVAGAQSHGSASKGDTAKGPKDGLEIHRLFTKKDQCPDPKDRVRETAVLNMNEEHYREFTDAPEKFVDKHDVFSCKIGQGKKLEHMVRKFAPPKAAAQGADPEVTVIHDLDCGGFWYDGGIS